MKLKNILKKFDFKSWYDDYYLDCNTRKMFKSGLHIWEVTSVGAWSLKINLNGTTYSKEYHSGWASHPEPSIEMLEIIFDQLIREIKNDRQAS